MSEKSSLDVIYERIKACANKRGFPSIAEDAAQEIYIRLLEGKHKNATVDQMFIDYLRRTHGDRRLISYESRKCLNNPSRLGTSELENLISYDFVTAIEDQIDFERLLSLFNHQEKTVMILYFQEGYTQSEIGEIFGVTKSMVCRWLEAIEVYISKRVNADEGRVSRYRAHLKRY